MSFIQNQTRLAPPSAPEQKETGAWYRQYFTQHPGYAAADPKAISGSGRTHDKVKVWCKKCLEKRVSEIRDAKTQVSWERGELALALRDDELANERE